MKNFDTQSFENLEKMVGDAGRIYLWWPFNNSQEALLEFPEKECLLVKIKVIWVISDEMRTTNRCKRACFLSLAHVYSRQ